MSTNKIENRTKSIMSSFAQKNILVNVSDSDFSEALTVTRTLFKDLVSKTSIVEASLACASASCDKADTISVSKIASFIVNNLNVKDCFHKREMNKANDSLKATVLRVRHHIADTIKVNHIADTLYSYNKQSDSVTFSEKYIKICKTDLVYRKKVSALIKRVKRQYNASVNLSKKAAKKATVNAEHAQLLANAELTKTTAKKRSVKLNNKNAEHVLFMKVA